MKTVPLEEFIGQFKPAMQVKLRQMAIKEDIAILVAWNDGEKLNAMAFKEEPSQWPEGTLSIYCKSPLQIQSERKSKTMQALDLVNSGMSGYAAAQKLGISSAAISRALSRRKAKDICPCCNQVVREGFKVNWSKLKKTSQKD